MAISFAWALLFAAAGCGRPATVQPQPAEDGAADAELSLALQRAQFQASFDQAEFLEEYRIGPGDLLDIEVVGKPEFSAKARVSPRGEVNMPIAGSARLGGLTPGEAALLLKQKLGDGYIKRPTVNVFVVEFTRYQALVYGAVNEPGIVELAGPRRLLDALMLAGGLKETAGSTVIIHRANPSEEMLAEQAARLEVLGSTDAAGKLQTLGAETIDLRRLVYEGDLSLNVPVFPQDRVNVLDAGAVYARGAIPVPGEYHLKGSRTTLTQIIAQAGGYLPFRANSTIEITRRPESGDGPPERLLADARAIISNEAPDLTLRDGDDIYFPSSWWRASIANTLAFFDRLLFGFGPRFVA